MIAQRPNLCQPVCLKRGLSYTRRPMLPVIQNWGEYIVMCSGLNPAVQHIVRANVVTQGLNKNSRIWLVCLSLIVLVSKSFNSRQSTCTIAYLYHLSRQDVPVMWFSAALPVRTLTQDAGMPAETRLKNVAHISSADGGRAQHGGNSWHRFRTARNIPVDRYGISVTWLSHLTDCVCMNTRKGFFRQTVESTLGC